MFEHLVFVLVAPVQDVRHSPCAANNIDFINDSSVSVPGVFQGKHAKHILEVIVGFPTVPVIVPIQPSWFVDKYTTSALEGGLNAWKRDQE